MVAAAQLAATAHVIEEALEAGWTTPRWLAFGLLPEGHPYFVEEFIDGTRTSALGNAELPLLLTANRAQADLWPRTDRDWSGYIRRVVFEGESG